MMPLGVSWLHPFSAGPLFTKLTQVHVHVHTCMLAHKYSTRTLARMHTRVCAHKRAHTRAHACTYTCSHTQTQVLDGPHDELRREALDTTCMCAVLMGTDFSLFVPIIRKVCFVWASV